LRQRSDPSRWHSYRAPDDADQLLTAFKVVGMTAAVLVIGAAVYGSGRKRAGVP
jgi:hypothetical protein